MSVLKFWNAATQEWEEVVAAPSGVEYFDDLLDVNLFGAQDGQGVYRDAGIWKPTNFPTRYTDAEAVQAVDDQDIGQSCIYGLVSGAVPSGWTDPLSLSSAINNPNNWTVTVTDILVPSAGFYDVFVGIGFSSAAGNWRIASIGGTGLSYNPTEHRHQTVGVALDYYLTAMYNLYFGAGGAVHARCYQDAGTITFNGGQLAVKKTGNP